MPHKMCKVELDYASQEPQEVKVPLGAVPVWVGFLNGRPTVFFRGSASLGLGRVKLVVVDTGQEFDEKLKFVGTASHANTVLHVFQVP